ncbi:hypothetical protein FD00_GL002010 [Liquorilactobacillus mali KCTC 3596 = DSM 20444]|uniref:Uncharacterized protein n=2 Tax=Liquorilactobacillus mali TaxID=1618 RepID=A0A0R2E2Z3_9LACO|nr:hypothetical protein FD00_GL002010 [Liquorilactobacillus mali KCTC 3596 = DSM 20444]
MWANRLPDTDPRIIFIQEYAKRREEEVREYRENNSDARKIMELHYLKGWTIKELAKEYCKTEWAITNIISKARRFFALDVKTGQLNRFKTFGELADFLDISIRNTRYYSKNCVLINERWRVFNQRQWLVEGEEMYEHLRK